MALHCNMIYLNVWDKVKSIIHLCFNQPHCNCSLALCSCFWLLLLLCTVCVCVACVGVWVWGGCVGVSFKSRYIALFNCQANLVMYRLTA